MLWGASSRLHAQTTVTWNTDSSGDWSDIGDWSPGIIPDNTGPNTYDIVLPDVDVAGPGFREVTLDLPDVTVNSVLVQEYPWPWTPAPPGPFDPFLDVLKLDYSLDVTTNIELSGSRATLDLNDQTVTAGTIQVDAPVFAYNEYWYRNAIAGDAGTNDGTSEALRSMTANDDGLPAATLLGGSYEGGYTVPTPAYVQPVLPVPTGGFTDPVPLTGSATTGTIDANIDTQGLVWLNDSPVISGTVLNHSQWGYFRYDGSSGQNITFQNTVTNSDPGAIMDLNGDVNEQAAVTNENGAYMYDRGAVNLSTNMVNQSGGQFLFDPTDSGTYFIDGNLTNTGTGTIDSPSTDKLTSGVSSYMDFVGNFTMGHDITGVNVVNENSAVMVMQGNVLIGQVDQLPKGAYPDIISSLENLTGGTYTYDPTGSQHMEITGQIINNGASTPGGYITTMNLLGDTIVRGRTLPSPLVTNINGAVLNYDAYIDVGYDTPNGQVVNQPQGNLDNNDGIINGYGDGNLLFRGGDQENGDATHTASYINLYDTAQFTTGPQGSNTFDNYGFVNGNSGTPTFNSGIFNNYGTLTANNGSTFTMTSATEGSAAAVNNYGTTIVNTGGTLDTVGGFVNYSTFTFNTGGALEGPFIYNDLDGIINATGGTVKSTALANNVGGTMNLGTGAAGSLVVESENVTQAGLVNIAANFNLVITDADLDNSGTINLNGVNANVTAEGNTIYNSGQINGGGTLGLAAGGYDESEQVINSSSTASIAVSSAGMTIGGTEAPINDGTITIASGGSGLAIIGGDSGSTFENNGSITIGDGGGGAILTDLGTGKQISNSGTITGKGSINFTDGIENSGTITANGALTLNNNVENEADSTPGTINIEDGASVLIPNMADFQNDGTINFNSTGTGALLSDGGSNSAFTNEEAGQVTVSGTNNTLSWGQGATNEGTITINSNAALTYPTAGLNNTGGFISLTRASLTGTGDLNNTTEGTIIATAGSTINTGDVTNDNATISLTGAGGKLTSETFDNSNGTLSAATGSSVATDSFDNTGGSVTIAGSTSTLSTDDFTNDGGLLTVSQGKASIEGTLSNGTSGGSTGIIEANNNANITTSDDVTNTGSLVVSGGSTFATNLDVVSYGDFDLNAGSGSVTVTGNSLWDVGDVTQNDGTVTISSGSAGDSFDYTINGGTLTLNSASTLAGRPTFKVRGDLTNAGAVDLLSGATLNLTTTGNLINSGTVSLSASTLTAVGAITNSGNLTLASASSASNTGALTNTGAISMQGASTFTDTGVVNNNGGSLTLVSSTFATNGAVVYSAFNNAQGLVAAGGTALFDVGTLTQTGGTISIGGGAAADTLAYANTGGAIVLNGATLLAGRQTLNVRGAFTNTGGSLSMLNGATMTTSSVFTNSGPSAVASLANASTVSAASLANTGTLSVESGSTFTSVTGPDSNAGGTLDVAAATVGVNALNNTGGEITDETGGILTNTGVLTNNNNGAALGEILLDAGGLLTNTGNVNTAGNITVEGASTFNAVNAATTFTNSGLAVSQGAGSSLNTFNLTNNAGATLKANSGGIITLAGAGVFTNNGTAIADPGGIIRTNGKGDVNNGTILVSGAASLFQTGPALAAMGNLQNTTGSSISLTSGGQMNVASLSNMTAAVTVSGAGTTLNVDQANAANQNGLLNNTGLAGNYANVDASTGAAITVGSYNAYLGNLTVDSGATFNSNGLGNNDKNDSGVITVNNTGAITFQKALNNLDGGTINVTGGGIGAANTTFTVNGTMTNSATVNVSGGKAVMNLNGVALQNGAAVTVQGLPGAISKINSNGQWTVANAANVYVGAFGDIDPPDVTTSGFIQVMQNGIFNADTFIQNGPGVTTDDGTMGGSFTLNGNNFQGGGLINGDVDNVSSYFSPGGITIASNTLTEDGTYTEQQGSMVIGIQGLGDSDALNATGALINGGNVDLILSPTYVPQIGDTFFFLNTAAGLTENQNFNVMQSINYSNGVFQAGSTADGAYVVFVVPEPASFTVLAATAGLLAMRRRRRAA